MPNNCFLTSGAESTRGGEGRERELFSRVSIGSIILDLTRENFFRRESEQRARHA